MRRVLGVVAVAVMLVALSGCASIRQGTVSDKVVEPERHYIVYCGKGCFAPRTDDEDYCFTLNGVNDDGETATAYICVEKDVWDSLTEGDYYDVDA